MISGPPGIGKTTSAHLIAKLCGFKPIEMNASDTRSKKLLEVSDRPPLRRERAEVLILPIQTMLKSTVDNTVLDGFLTGQVSLKFVEIVDIRLKPFCRPRTRTYPS